MRNKRETEERNNNNNNKKKMRGAHFIGIQFITYT